MAEEGRDTGPAQASKAAGSSRRGIMLLVGGALAVALVGLGIRGLAHPAKGDVGGLPPPILPQAANGYEVAAPAAIGSPPEAAEVEELRSIVAKRTEAQASEASYWQEKGAVLRWNEIGIGLIVKYNTNPVVASRVMALLSVAQHDALLAVVRAQRTYKRPAPAGITPLFASQAESTYPSEHAAVAAASAEVLSYCFGSKVQGEELHKRAKDHEESRLWAGVSRRSDVAAGDEIGREVGLRVVARGKVDHAAEAGINWHGNMPTGPDKWTSMDHPATVPLRPLWHQVTPWLLSSPDQFRPPAPPKIDSPEFAKAIEEVKKISVTRTKEQLETAKYWADSPGSPTPAGHWNVAASKIIADRDHATPRPRDLAELTAARDMALLNIATMDAGIACWDAKYTYWYLRPSQADPTITLPVGLPNFPSYPSGHSCFSGAAAEVLGYLFPSEKERMEAMANEASMSRVYGGIHYMFECQAGLKIGRSIGHLAIEKAKAELDVP